MMKFTEKPLITVGITSYNRPHTLFQVLKSIVDQTYSNIEIIVCDDCSSDERVHQVINEFEKKFDNIRSITYKENTGSVTELFNLIVKNANGKYLLYLNDDDWVDENYIEECLKTLQENPEYVLATGKTKFYHNDRYAFDASIVDIVEEKPVDRFLSFHDKVLGTGNCPNFGLINLELKEHLHMNNYLGHDNVLIGNLAILGKIRTIKSTCIHRRLGGSSESLEKSAVVHKYSDFERRFSNFALMKNLLEDIVISSKAFAKFSLVERCWTAIVFAFTVFVNLNKYMNRFKIRKCNQVKIINELNLQDTRKEVIATKEAVLH